MDPVDAFTYLILDTNYWIYLAKGEHPEVFTELINEVDSGKIILLLPETVQYEWNMHKAAVINEVEKSILEQSEKAYQIAEFLSEPDKESFKNIEDNYRNNESNRLSIANRKFEAVKDLIDNKCKLIPVNADVKHLAIKQALDKKAPFGPNDGKNSMGDALILFTAIEYLKSIGIYGKDNAIFISFNDKDFSQDKQHKDIIHPDLAPLFAEIGLVYERQIFKALKLTENLLIEAQERFDKYYDSYIDSLIDNEAQYMIDISIGK